MAGGFAVIYMAGDLVLENPVESCSIFIFVIVVSAALEYLLQVCGHSENKYFRIIFEAISEEIMIVGILALLLLFCGGILQGFNERYVKIFNWAHMCLFWMSVFFAGIIAGMIVAIKFNNKGWRVFEETRQNTDPRLSKNEIRYKLACENFKATLEYIGVNGESLRFSDYNGKMQRHNVVDICDLSWKSWCGLSIIVLVNMGRAQLVSPKNAAEKGFTVNNMTNFELISSFGSYFMVIGYGTLACFLIINVVIQKRMTHYLDKPIPALKSEDAGKTAEERLKKLDDPERFLLFGTRETTLAILQVVIMFFEWYLSVFSLGMIHEVVTNFTADRFFPGCSFAVIMIAIAPPIIFIYTLPWTIFCITCMSALGSNLDYAVVRRMLKRNAGDDDDEEAQEGGGGHGGHGGGHGGHGHAKGAAAKGAHGGQAHGEHGDAHGVPRPSFLDDDEDWNGEQTMAAQNPLNGQGAHGRGISMPKNSHRAEHFSH